jgi:hypothetical protein
MPSISKVFNIPENYTLEQLKSSYVYIMENLAKSSRPEIEKDLLSDQYKLLYKQGKQIYMNKKSNNPDKLENFGLQKIDNFSNIFDNLMSKHLSYMSEIKNGDSKSSQVYSYSNTSSYSSKTNPDGSKTIIKSSSESKNGNKNSILSGYKKLPNGQIIPLDENELKQIAKSSDKLKQIKNF